MYGLGWSLYRFLYDAGLKKAKAPHSPILVVGNLTVGGSGKTPVVVEVVRLLLQGGKQVVIGASGYGSPHAEGATRAPNGPLDAQVWGDEPALLRLLLPEVPMIVGRARVRAAEIAASQFEGSVLVMDDGFQHLPLRHTASILIDPASDNRFCLPAGPYREPRSNLKRATLVIGPGQSFQARSTLEGVQDLDTFGSGKAPVSFPEQADVLCAIGRPQQFLDALEGVGVDIRRAHVLADHADLQSFDFGSDGLPLIVTGKDAVKLKGRADLGGRPIFVACQEVSIEPQGAFRNALMEMVSWL